MFWVATALRFRNKLTKEESKATQYIQVWKHYTATPTYCFNFAWQILKALRQQAEILNSDRRRMNFIFVIALIWQIWSKLTIPYSKYLPTVE